MWKVSEAPYRPRKAKNLHQRSPGASPQQAPAQSSTTNRSGSSPKAMLFAVFLGKVSKHLALLACIMILGHGSGQFSIGQVGIFTVVIFSALAHTAGRRIQTRLSNNKPLKNRHRASTQTT